jgi:CBS domain-containing protein
MLATTRTLNDLTAGDLMSGDVISVTEEMPLREAVRLLLLHQISGAPVVESGGTCVGVISTMDILRWAWEQYDAPAPKGQPRPLSCSFQIRQRQPNGEDRTLCTLLSDVCPLQRKERGADGKERFVCGQPHSVLADWQIVEMEQLPTERVEQFMSIDPVMVPADMPIAELAQRMIDAHIHRVVVIDERCRPLGIVSTMDILAGIAHAALAPVAEGN